MNNMVSVVIPVFRVEKYVGNCIKSLMCQTYGDFELIIVNDGTDDNSMPIITDLLKTSPINYRIINQENQGVSSARNVGIANSLGKWILCVDPDDIVEPNYIETLIYVANKTNVDAVSCNYQNIYIGETIIHDETPLSFVVYEQNEILNKFLVRDISLLSPGMLISKKFLQDSEIIYNNNIRFAEDVHYIWNVLLNSLQIAYINNKLYLYLLRPNSTVTSSNVSKIMTGYYGFLKFKDIVAKKVNANFASLLIARWVFAALHLAAHTVTYKDYKILAHKMNYKQYLNDLIKFPDKRVKMISILLKYNIFLFREIMRRF